MSFVFPPLLWIGLPLAAAPILLHLLNLRRQRRVAWAAMEFLLESEERNKTWVNLQQWLLLAARVAAVALIALMLAGPRVEGGLAAWFAAERVRHVIVLDDSYSMSQRGSRFDAWRDALSAVQHVIARAAESPGHRVSIFRTSKTRSQIDPSTAEPISASGRQELVRLAERVGAWRPTQAADQLDPAVSAAARHARSQPSSESLAAYVVSDFRTRNTDPVERLGNALKDLEESAQVVRLICCSNGESENVTLAGLTLLPGARAAGIELTGEVTVANRGRRAVERVTVSIERDGTPLPAVLIDAIGPGESVSRQFPVRFDSPGSHSLAARVDADAIEADNQRYFAAALPESRPVLLIDGSEGGCEGLAYAAALGPAGVATGWRPVRAGAQEIQSAADLEAYAAVLLLDQSRVSPTLAQSLRAYFDRGGGLFVGLGPSIERKNYNLLLFGDQQSLLPAQLDVPTQAPPRADEGEIADVSVTDHPLFRVFAGDRNSFLQLITVNYYYGLLGDQAPVEPSSAGVSTAAPVKAIAKLRGGAPLFVERINGPGRVVGLLTAAARRPGESEGWSSLGVSPAFPVLVNELVAYLAEPRLREPPRLVGQAWSSMGLMDPVDTTFQATRIDAPAAPQPTVRESVAPAESGLYRARTSATAVEGMLVAVNVEPAEGDLRGPTIEELGSRFAGGKVAVATVAELLRTDRDVSQASLARGLAVALLGLLLIEKLLSVAGSHHQPSAARRPA